MMLPTLSKITSTTNTPLKLSFSDPPYKGPTIARRSSRVLTWDRSLLVELELIILNMKVNTQGSHLPNHPNLKAHHNSSQAKRSAAAPITTKAAYLVFFFFAVLVMVMYSAGDPQSQEEAEPVQVDVAARILPEYKDSVNV